MCTLVCFSDMYKNNYIKLGFRGNLFPEYYLRILRVDRLATLFANSPSPHLLPYDMCAVPPVLLHYYLCVLFLLSYGSHNVKNEYKVPGERTKNSIITAMKMIGKHESSIQVNDLARILGQSSFLLYYLSFH